MMVVDNHCQRLLMKINVIEPEEEPEEPEDEEPERTRKNPKEPEDRLSF